MSSKISYNVNCGIRPLKSNERRGSKEECIKKAQIRYYGLVKIDPILLEKPKKISKKEERQYNLGRLMAIKSRVMKIKGFLELKKIQENEEKFKKYTNELEKLRKDYNSNIAEANRRERLKVEMYNKIEEEKQHLDELHYKTIKKSNKNTTNSKTSNKDKTKTINKDKTKTINKDKTKTTKTSKKTNKQQGGKINNKPKNRVSKKNSKQIRENKRSKKISKILKK